MNKSKLAKAEGLWRNFVRNFWGGRCFMCDRMGSDCHHIVSRKHRWLAFHPLNGVLLCFRHHREVHSKGDKRLRQLIELHHPDWHEAIEELRVWERQQTASFKKDDLEEAIKVLEGIVWPVNGAIQSKCDAEPAGESRATKS